MNEPLRRWEQSNIQYLITPLLREGGSEGLISSLALSANAALGVRVRADCGALVMFAFVRVRSACVYVLPDYICP